MLCTWLYLILHVRGMAKAAGKMKSGVVEFPSHEVISFYSIVPFCQILTASIKSYIAYET